MKWIYATLFAIGLALVVVTNALAGSTTKWFPGPRQVYQADGYFVVCSQKSNRKGLIFGRPVPKGGVIVLTCVRRERMPKA